MSDPTASKSHLIPIGEARRIRRTTVILILAGVALLFIAAVSGYVIGNERQLAAHNPLDVIADMGPAGVNCAQVIQVDEAGGDRAAVCISTEDEILTVGTFATPPDPDEWADKLCAVNEEGATPARGALVTFNKSVVTIVDGPLATRENLAAPDAEVLAESIATTLNGEWRPYAC